MCSHSNRRRSFTRNEDTQEENILPGELLFVESRRLAQSQESTHESKVEWCVTTLCYMDGNYCKHSCCTQFHTRLFRVNPGVRVDRVTCGISNRGRMRVSRIKTNTCSL